jgi:Icc-related predicted phosphoesterase
MKILCTSDLHGDFATLNKLCDMARGFDLVVVAGDLTNFSSPKVAEQIVGDLQGCVKALLVVPGNCDLPETAEAYKKFGISLHGEGMTLGDVGFFGVGGSNKTPFNTPLEYTENEIKDLLEEGYEDVKDAKIKVLVTHSPPYETVDKTSSGISVGSKAVREFINNHKVDFVVCGHVHECRGVENLGDTVIVNTGPACYSYLDVRIDEKGKVSHEFIELSDN